MLTLASDKNRLAASSDEVKRTLDIVWSAYRSVLSKEGGLAYVSTAITTGRRMWEAVFAHGFKTPDELKVAQPALLRDAIIVPNIRDGSDLARQIASRVDQPVVAPAIFEARPQRWSQDEYMAMWLRMIEESVHWMYMAPGWEYSNGGTEEYLHSVQMGLGFRTRFLIEPLNPDGTQLAINTAIDKIGAAILWIHENGGRAPSLAHTYRALYTIYTAWHAPDFASDLPKDWNRGFPVRDHSAGQDIRTLRDCSRLFELDYGLSSIYTDMNGKDGAPRSKDALPEGIFLRAEDPA